MNTSARPVICITRAAAADAPGNASVQGGLAVGLRIVLKRGSHQLAFAVTQRGSLRNMIEDALPGVVEPLLNRRCAQIGPVTLHLVTERTSLPAPMLVVACFARPGHVKSLLASRRCEGLVYVPLAHEEQQEFLDAWPDATQVPEHELLIDGDKR